MNYEVGKSYIFDDQERLVIGIDGSGYPVTRLMETKGGIPANSQGHPGGEWEIQREEFMARIEVLEDEKVWVEGERKELLETNARLIEEVEGLKGQLLRQTPEQDAIEEKATAQETLAKDMTCRYCGRTCGSPVGLAAHEKACEKNPGSTNYKA